LLFIKVNKKTIVVISAHVRFISATPVHLLGWVFACYGPSAFYLEVVEQNAIFFLFFSPPKGGFSQKRERTQLIRKGQWEACFPCFCQGKRDKYI